jgi:antitoxin Phd
MQNTNSQTSASAWRLQDAKAQFSALVDNALRGVPQHVMRRGKPAVVVLSEQDFEALQGSAAGRASKPASLMEHLLAVPKAPVGKVAETPCPDVQPRNIDFS